MEAFAPAAALAPATLPAAFVSPSNLRTLRIASAGYASAPGDTPASTPWTPRLLGDVEVGQTAVDALGLGGRAALAAAAIEIWDGDGFAADLARYGTATGRAVAVRLAEVRSPRASDVGTPLAQARLVFAGTVAAVDRTEGQRARISLGPGFGAAEFDADAWTLADADLPGPIGFYQAATPTTALAAAETVLAGCGAILAGDRTGRLRLSDPLARDPVPQFDIPAAWILECRPVALPAAFQPPPRVVEVAWGRNWSPLSNMAGSVPAADRQRLEAAQSVARAESTLVTSRVAQQRSLALPGLYATEAAAVARAGRWRDWVERGPRLVAVTTDRYLGQIEIGQIGRIAYPAYGLDAGLSGVVVGWREALAGRRVEIILAGSD
ncbi:hypothetical protein [Falsiroseomonas ponticola]|uniref:hypothetical protein n=1 Tax=Falsiroseomonas ponticola TaxID=2786951 RepID=UPI001934368B|nr:hypothetical protein [Roseomonas ponticola]